MGSLTVIFGPMFSGKTTRLIHELTRFVDVTTETHKTKCLLINHIFDDRDRNMIVSSHGSSFKGVSSLIDLLQTDNLEDIAIDNYNVIGIDEAQFFRSLNITLDWIKKGKIVIICGLIADSFMRPFGQLHSLITYADNVIQCHAICSECIKCKTTVITPDVLSGMKAAFTFRLDASIDQIDIGAADKYIPVCRYHYDILANV